MSRLRILVLAPFCDPEDVSMPYVAYCHAAALAQLHDVTLVVGAPVEDKVRRAKASFEAIEAVRMPTLERVHAWIFRNVLKSNFDTQMLTILSYPFSIAFESHAWRRMRTRIIAGEFDVVLRLLPLLRSCPALSFSFCERDDPLRDRSDQWWFAMA